MRIFITIFTIFIISFCKDSLADSNISEEEARVISNLCTSNFAKYERQYHIPKNILYAISMTESGRNFSWEQKPIPWPWTINAQGKSYYYNNMHNAIIAAQNFQNSGIKSIDIGCMQINLHHHAKAFINLFQAFNPAKNIAYSAKFLTGNYRETRSWKKAISRYHSKNKELARKYIAKVGSNFNIISAKRSEIFSGVTIGRFASNKINKKSLKRKKSIMIINVNNDGISTRDSFSYGQDRQNNAPEILIIRPRNKIIKNKVNVKVTKHLVQKREVNNRPIIESKMQNNGFVIGKYDKTL